MFKIKAGKKHLSDKRTTLDTKHNDMLEEFQKQRHKEIKQLTKELKTLQKRQQELNTIAQTNHNNNITHKITYNFLFTKNQEKIDEIQQKINKITNNDYEIEYLLNVCPIIYSYMSYKDEYKDKKIIKPNNVNRQKIKKKASVTNLNKYNSLSSFVTIEESVQNEKARLLYEYLSIIDENESEKYKPLALKQFEQNRAHTCKYCQMQNLIDTGEFISCQNCGAVYEQTVLSETPSYRESQQATVITKFSYKRLNHFRDWLNLFQGKEHTEIPDHIYTKLRNEIRKYKLRRHEITPGRIKTFMKKLGLNRYYEHIPFIINHLTGQKPPILDKSMEKQFIIMFHEMQEPFLRHKPKNRKNFLSYSYVLHKLCQLLELDHLLCRFPLLKNREKLHQQDVIWKHICEDLQWQFIKSV